ncbi:cyclophilin-like fold protein [Paraflavitalea sp. CAU 1676]|uniref:cyclophilin-like fold protein n=1 Tax=Paraflavitalea sp. CAU 1676 TaxID=3032598 RepID=UPI0023DA94B6|nr:cyclophilin-like fold protein [Paraflavitalea sp. CAU 1676]MDF2192159.1 cyclophilin-like fold protein [Paraflavitalea sp. CAU 1676]
MRWTTMAMFLLFSLLCTAYAACGKSTGSNNPDTPPTDTASISDTTIRKMKVTIGSATFHVTLASNASAKAFLALLPLTVSMTELNGNEKYYDLPNNLPTNATNPGTIKTGDLLLWGSKTVVLFYKTFSTSYSYTRLGVIDNPDGLAAAVGAGNVTVSFEKE